MGICILQADQMLAPLQKPVPLWGVTSLFPFEVQLARALLAKAVCENNWTETKAYLSGRVLAYHTWSLGFDCQQNKQVNHNTKTKQKVN